MHAFTHDLRYVLRGLRRAPGFTLVVVLTLALGIGANTAIFSVVDQLVLRPVPYPDGDQVLRVDEFSITRARPSNVNPGNWLDWQRQSQTIDAFAAWDPITLTLSSDGPAQRVQALQVSAEYFPLLGVAPLLGRTLSQEDDRPNAARVAVLSYGMWQRRFGGDPAVLGRRIQLNDGPTEVIGVMPSTFRFVVPDTEFWTAFQLDRSRAWRDTAGRFMSVVARTKPGVSLAQARAEMDAIARGLQSARINQGMTVQLTPIREGLVGEHRAPMLALLGAVVALLAIACLNVASLLLARTLARSRDAAVRASIGGNRAALIRPLFLESLALACAGGVLGVLVARWSMAGLLALAPPEVLPVAAVQPSHALLLYTVATTLVAGLAIGLVPAWLATRRSLVDLLRTGSHAGPGAARVRQALVAAQVAMTVILLCGAGLLARTVSALLARDAGFDRQNLLTMNVELPPARYDERGRVEFIQRAQARLAALPGVTATGAAFSLPVTGPQVGRTSVNVFGQAEISRNDLSSAAIRIVTPGYFRAIGEPVLRGREFTDADQAAQAPLVFVVNEAFVASFLGGRDPLGATISVGMQRENPYAPIVGVVRDVSEGSLWEAGQPTVYYNHAQLPSPAMVLLVKAGGSVPLARAAVNAIHELDANLAVADVQLIETAFAESVGRERLMAVVSGAFGLSGLLLASLGLYGLLAFTVTERSKEIGIRMALGAQVGPLLRGVIGRGLRMVAIGAGAGIVGAFAMLRAAGSLFFGVTPYDVTTYAEVLILLALVTVVATLAPARRAALLDPVKALRTD